MAKIEILYMKLQHGLCEDAQALGTDLMKPQMTWLLLNLIEGNILMWTIVSDDS